MKPIKIKPSHVGALHRHFGEKPGTKLTTHQLMMAKGSPDPKVRRQATFAMNARHWSH